MDLMKELMKLVESATDSNTPAWYVVRITDDAISAGPFAGRPSDSKLATFNWYNKNDYVVEFGTMDLEHDGSYDKFKDMPAK